MKPLPITLAFWLVVALTSTAVAGQNSFRAVSTLGPSQPLSVGADGDSGLPVLSADGRYVLFASTAHNLVVASNGLALPATMPARLNVFLRDRVLRTTTLVSASTNGVAGGDGDSFPIDLSTNNQFALFESAAANLVAGDTNNAADIFLRDLTNGTIWLVSANTNGLPGNGGCRSAVMTPDGRYVAFVSEASDLAPADTNRIADIFLRDLQTATTTLVSVGAQATNAGSYFTATSEDPQISADGRFIAYSSTATNLVPGVITTGDIYVFDRLAGTNIWASSSMRALLYPTNTVTTNGVGYNPALSADGNFVMFQASRLPFANNNYSGAIFRYGLQSGVTDLIETNAPFSIPTAADTRNLDVTSDGTLVAFAANATSVQATTTCVRVWSAATGLATLVSGDASNAVPAATLSTRPVFDASGRYIAFRSTATGLVSNALAGAYHVYVRDLLAAATTLVDADTNTVGAGVTSTTVPSLSADGRFVAFESADGGLVPNDNNRCLDVFVRDLVAGTNELISIALPALTSALPNGPSVLSASAASADGRFIAFASESDNLATTDTNGFRDVFVRDLANDSNVLVSCALGGGVGNGISFEPVISGNGRYLAFTSSATNLVAADANGASDVLVRDLQTGVTTLASLNAAGTTAANSNSHSPKLSADGRWLLFRSQANNLTSGSLSATENLFLRDLLAGTNYALTSGGVTAAAVTPDGRFVAFVGNVSGVSYLYVWDSNSKARVFTNTTSGITAAAISCDGRFLAYCTSTQLRVVDRHAGTNWLLAPLTSPLRAPPQFSADGQWLVQNRYVSTTAQVYLNNLKTGAELLVSHAMGSIAGGDGHSELPELGADGRFIVYRTRATNVVAGADGQRRHIVLYDCQTGLNTLVTVNPRTGLPANSLSPRAQFSADGQTLLVQSWASDLVDNDWNSAGDIFARPIFTAILVPPAGPGQGPWLYWPWMPGQNYRVQFKDHLGDPAWQELPGSNSTVGVKVWQQDATPAGIQRFYRIRSN